MRANGGSRGSGIPPSTPGLRDPSLHSTTLPLSTDPQGAIIIFGILPLFDGAEGLYLWRVSKFDWLVWTTGLLITAFAGVEIGIITTVAVSVLLLLIKQFFPVGDGARGCVRACCLDTAATCRQPQPPAAHACCPRLPARPALHATDHEGGVCLPRHSRLQVRARAGQRLRRRQAVSLPLQLCYPAASPPPGATPARCLAGTPSCTVMPGPGPAPPS